ncbi:bifunctional riboflavin kinase/FAD synthetase [Virgibacillus sp. W0181]|uniref:bifunctional riboflavin kinase/FAD synthetase n=1 Tax=Virgibacillus sp. W0181 TaxID=3391581 RepID=UPI003F46790C
METIYLTYPHPYQVENLPETTAAIGFFDGIHKGHQKVIRTAVKQAQKKKMASAVITFSPHPSVILKRDQTVDVKYITPLPEKQELMRKLQVDRLYIITFNNELSALPPQQFIDHFIIGLNIKHVVAGFDFSFGYKGKGNMQNINQFSSGLFSSEAIDKVEEDDEKISSTKIRKLLNEGNMKKANTLLGRHLTVSGKVIDGAKRGRTIGYPTANLQIDKEALLPKTGVYAVKTYIQGDEKAWEGMANLGTNPTFTDDTDVSLEVHLLDFDADLYGKNLTIEWHQFIRDEEKYDDVNDLIKQIQEDEQTIRAIFQDPEK